MRLRALLALSALFCSTTAAVAGLKEGYAALSKKDYVTAQQYAQLEKASRLTALGQTARRHIERGKLQLSLALPRQAVSLVVIKY